MSQLNELTILVVDDEEFLRTLIADYLEDMDYDVAMASNGYEALAAIDKNMPDMVLLDLRMPEMDGFELLPLLAERYPMLPVIVISGVGVIEDAVQAVRLGAWDFITKPIKDFNILAHSMAKCFERHNLLQENRNYRMHLEEEVQRQTSELRALNQEIVETQKELITTLGEVVESRSKETAYHVRRVAEYCRLLALKIGLPEEEADLIRLAAPMHDVGKIGITDSILNKPGKLTKEEFEIIKTHTTIGHEILMHSTRPLMHAAADIALQHHERWDGRGYPHGLKADNIHLYGRIVALADVFDALS